MRSRGKDNGGSQRTGEGRYRLPQGRGRCVLRCKAARVEEDEREAR